MEGSVNGGHKNLYKQAGKDVSEIQKATKEALLTGQRQRRERLLTRKRLKVETLDEADSHLSAEEKQIQVEQAAKMLKTGKKLEALRTLHQCFATDSKNSETFLKLDGLPLLQSCLLSTDSTVLHAAAWCAINLSAADTRLSSRVMGLSPLLIQFLQGSDTVMQELCAWAVGNLAGDSQGNKETLLQQGVIPHLLHLVSSAHHIMSESRTQSVLFALINLTSSQSYSCIRCMQEHSLFSSLKSLLTDVHETSELTLEIGWLVSSVYSRKDTFNEHRGQYEMILHLVLQRVGLLSKLPETQWKERVMFPYLVCCRNIIGLSSEMSLLASDLPSFAPTILACLHCDSVAIQTDTLGVLTNFAAEPSCRAFIICHSELLGKLFSLSTKQDLGLVSELLYLMGAMSRVSGLMSQLLVKRGALASLSVLLSHSSLAVTNGALAIVEALLLVLEAGAPDTQTLKESLKNLISVSFDNKVVERARALTQQLNTDQ